MTRSGETSVVLSKTTVATSEQLNGIHIIVLGDTTSAVTVSDKSSPRDPKGNNSLPPTPELSKVAILQGEMFSGKTAAKNPESFVF